MSFLARLRTFAAFLGRKPFKLGHGLLSVYDYLIEPERTEGSPFFLQIEPTILCNLECAFCINPFLPRSRVSLSLEHFRQVIGQFPQVAKISLVGIGESFMNRELWQIVREAKSRGIQIGTTTNGTILSDQILNEIFNSGLDWLNFSLDGATKTTYEKMRPGAVFEQVLTNIRKIVTTANGRKRPVFSVWFLGNRENIAELPRMVSLVKDLGISKLNTQGVHYWGHPDWHQRANEANAISELREILLQVKKLAKESGIQFQWHNFPDPSRERGCKWPWKGSYITADGYVTPCCENGSDPNRINFGNLFQTPYHQIWNAPQYQEFRRQLRSSNDRPSICIDCPSYHEPITL